MSSSRRLTGVVLLLFSGAVCGQSDGQDDRQADRVLLRDLLAKVERALNQHDVDAITPYLHPGVVVTYQNAEVSRGVDEVKDFYTRMLLGPDAVVKDFSTRPVVSAPAVFYGNTAVAHGTTAERYVLAEGLDLALDTRWTATAIKDDDGWKLAALHLSANLFDNPVLAAAHRMLWLAAAGGFAVGVVLILVVRRRVRR